MKDTEENNIFILYLPMVIVALLIQLSLAGLILRLNKDILDCTVWSDEENRAFWERTREKAGTVQKEPPKLDLTVAGRWR